MVWIFRKKKNITTPTNERKNLPHGLWVKPACGCTLEKEEFRKNMYVCPNDGYHFPVGSKEYFEILFDKNIFEEIDADLAAKNPLKWSDKKSYEDRIKDAQKKTGLKEAIRCAVGKLKNQSVVISCMDFSFIGGSMGSVMGEKISRSIGYCIKHKLPYVLISKSGGARMMEAPFSLMQMAKTLAKLAQLSKAKLPFLSVLTYPTTGGVTASYALLGDVNIAEPNSLIGFAGPRLIKRIIGKELPEGFQSAEYLMKKGFLDKISSRLELKNTISSILSMLS